MCYYFVQSQLYQFRKTSIGIGAVIKTDNIEKYREYTLMRYIKIDEDVFNFLKNLDTNGLKLVMHTWVLKERFGLYKYFYVIFKTGRSIVKTPEPAKYINQFKKVATFIEIDENLFDFLSQLGNNYGSSDFGGIKREIYDI